ncbi:MAG TPA: fructose-bisphosphatase class II [Gaiellaceae bacterium]|nr:fructose-bisphosphatase class II [Gaiellaceae bacterium]
MTERAALAGARWLGRADDDAAERDAAEGMSDVLGTFPVHGRIVIGSADEESPLRVGEEAHAAQQVAVRDARRDDDHLARR